MTNSWPYIDSYHANETDEHIRLKNLAAYWLLNRGFDREDIEAEYNFYGHVDVYAEQDGVRVCIECETNFHGMRQYNGVDPQDANALALVFKSDGIFQVVPRYVEYEDTDGNTHEKKFLDLERMGDLPLVQLSAFKE